MYRLNANSTYLLIMLKISADDLDWVQFESIWLVALQARFELECSPFIHNSYLQFNVEIKMVQVQMIKQWVALKSYFTARVM